MVIVVVAPSSLDGALLWETFNTAAYELGGIIFILGSVAFLPAFHAYLPVGVYLFIIGSLLYLIVAAHDTFEVLQAAEEAEDDDDDDDEDDKSNDKDSSAQDDDDDAASASTSKRTSGHNDGKHFSRRTRYRLDLAAALIYVAGSVLFILGSLVFLPSIEQAKLGAVLFIVGSLLFAVGALINMVQIFESHDRAAASLLTALLANLTAAFYLIGSTMFGVASVPYLFDFEATADANLIFTFLGWNYIVGSIAFTVGGTMNYMRARIVLREQLALYEARAKAQEEKHLRHVHKQQQQQQYAYNNTWSAETSLLYHRPESQAPSTKIESTPNNNTAGSDDAHHATCTRVLWKDDLVPAQASVHGAAASGRQQPSLLQTSATTAPLMEIFQVDPTVRTTTTTTTTTDASSPDETTSLLSNPTSRQSSNTRLNYSWDDKRSSNLTSATSSKDKR